MKPWTSLYGLGTEFYERATFTFDGKDWLVSVRLQGRWSSVLNMETAIAWGNRYASGRRRWY